MLATYSMVKLYKMSEYSSILINYQQQQQQQERRSNVGKKTISRQILSLTIPYGHFKFVLTTKAKHIILFHRVPVCPFWGSLNQKVITCPFNAHIG
jgi:hypothetical protein